MRAVCWYGRHDMRVQKVPDPQILNPRDAIVRITSTAICLPFGSVMKRSLTIRTGQTHVQRYLQPLLERVQRGKIDPAVVITHRVNLDDAPQAYRMFCNKDDGCIKVVLKP